MTNKIDMPRIFLAGPEGYLFDAREQNEVNADLEISLAATRAKLLAVGRTRTMGPAVSVTSAKARLCGDYGLEGVSVINFDHAGFGKKHDVASIGEEFQTALLSCQGLIANLTPFRGISADPPVIFAVGYMRALGRPIWGYTTSAIGYERRTILYRMRPRLPFDADSRECTLHPYETHEDPIIQSVMNAYALARPSSAGKITEMEAFEVCVLAAHEFFKAPARLAEVAE